LVNIKNYWLKKNEGKIKILKENDEKMKNYNEKLKKMNLLRHDFEKIRILCDLVIKREKIKNKIYQTNYEEVLQKSIGESINEQNKTNIKEILQNGEKDIKTPIRKKRR
jgi:uncharacterized protein YbgA (DUF1722 family)